MPLSGSTWHHPKRLKIRIQKKNESMIKGDVCIVNSNSMKGRQQFHPRKAKEP